MVLVAWDINWDVLQESELSGDPTWIYPPSRGQLEERGGRRSHHLCCLDMQNIIIKSHIWHPQEMIARQHIRSISSDTTLGPRHLSMA